MVGIAVDLVVDGIVACIGSCGKRGGKLAVSSQGVNQCATLYLASGNQRLRLTGVVEVSNTSRSGSNNDCRLAKGDDKRGLGKVCVIGVTDYLVVNYITLGSSSGRNISTVSTIFTQLII